MQNIYYFANDILFSTKMERESSTCDTCVNVDNFVEIGDFLDILDILFKKILRKDVEKSIDGF